MGLPFQHRASLVGSKLGVTLEIQVEISDGVPDQVVRTVSENCNTLKFKFHGFEESGENETEAAARGAWERGGEQWR